NEAVQVCFERLFEKHGLPEAIRSDNGTPFASTQSVLGLSRLSAWWLVLGIDLERGRKGCPQDNGAHERLHWDVERELKKQQWSDRQAALDEWRETFNSERPHESLGMRCPAEVYKPSARRYEGTPQELSYAGMVSRKVHSLGYIHWQKQRVAISAALAGWSVGLEARGQSKYDVWFGRLLLGQFDESSASFKAT